MAKKINITAQLNAATTDGILADAGQIFDAKKGKFQEQVNEEFEDALEEAITSEETDMVVESIEEGIVHNALRKTEQILTEAEKGQARENIGAVSEQTFENEAVRVKKQVFTSEQKYQARHNISAITAEEAEKIAQDKINENAVSSPDKLQAVKELSSWLEENPDNAATMNAAIQDNYADIQRLYRGTGIDEYSQFSTGMDYAAGDVVLYDGVLFRFKADHAKGEWDYNEVEDWSEKKEREKKLTDGKAFDNEKANKILPAFYVHGDNAGSINWDNIILLYVFNGYADSIKLQFRNLLTEENFDTPRLNPAQSAYYNLPITIDGNQIYVSFVIDWSFIPSGTYYDAHHAMLTSYAFLEGYFTVSKGRLEDKSITREKLADNALDIIACDGVEDFSIEDTQGNKVLSIVRGLPVTKNFNGLKTPRELNEDIIDFSIKDEKGNVVFAIVRGIPKTKYFDGRDVLDKLTSPVEGWSRLPLLENNPLAKIKYDGGMARIFKNWGFIGDSLNSGEMYGLTTSEITLNEVADRAISNGGIITDVSSVITEEKLISGYNPMMKLIFNSNDGLNGKILCAKSADNSSIITGTTSLEYVVSITSGTSVLLSYPSNNKPQILLQFTYVKDMYDLSWGQQMVRLLGASGYNFSVGGEYCKRWCNKTSDSDNDRRWNKVQLEVQQGVVRDAYTIALGVNDRSYWMAKRTEVVDYPCVTAYPKQSQYGNLTLSESVILADVDFENYDNNANSYAGWYAGIIQRLKSVRKDAHIFCITNPAKGQKNSEWNQVVRVLVKKLNEYYGNNTIWLVDLAEYNEMTNELNEYTDLNGHLSAFGYLYFAYQISTYIDWIIRNNILDFKGSSLIGTGASANSFELI